MHMYIHAYIHMHTYTHVCVSLIIYGCACMRGTFMFVWKIKIQNQSILLVHCNIGKHKTFLKGHMCTGQMVSFTKVILLHEY